ncbi:hypothetical protein CHUAL_009209 [Chamberlinius hualienensis]
MEVDQFNESVQIIRKWIETEAPFRGRTDFEFIARYLKACDIDIEETKNTISKYYTFRKLYPLLMRNRDINEKSQKKIFDRCIVTTDASQSEYQLPIVVLLHIGKLRSDDNLYEFAKVLFAGIESMTMEWNRPLEYGCILVYDFSNVQLSVIFNTLPRFLEQYTTILAGSLPLRARQIHFINVGIIMRTIINIGLRFIPQNSKAKHFVHGGSWECLQEYIPPQCLPIECGGTNGTMEQNNEEVLPVFQKWRDYLIDDEQYGLKN